MIYDQCGPINVEKESNDLEEELKTAVGLEVVLAFTPRKKLAKIWRD